MSQISHKAPEQLQAWVVGSLNMDFVLFVKASDELGHRQCTEEEDLELPGGMGANQAVALYRMSRHKPSPLEPASENPTFLPFELAVSMIGMVGDKDNFGERIKKKLNKNGIGTDAVQTANNSKTGYAHVWLSPNGTTKIESRGHANLRLQPTDVEKSWPASKVDLVVVQLEIQLKTASKAIELAKRDEALVILNMAPPQSPGILVHNDTLFGVDHLIMNNRDADSITMPPNMTPEKRRDIFALQKRYSEMCGRFHDLGTACVVITLGDMGVLASYLEPTDNDGTCRKLLLHGAKVGDGGVRDETGAADTFVGAYAVEILRQLHDPRKDLKPCKLDIGAAVDMGIKAAGLCVGTVGSMEGVPWRNEVVGTKAREFYAAHPY